MMRWAELEFVRHLILKLFYLRRIKLDYLSALGTDHVIVMLMFEMMLIIGSVIAETYLARESGIGEEFERPINGSMAYRRVLLLHEPIQIFARKMFFRAKKYFHYEVALTGTAQSRTLNMLEKDLFLL